MTHFFLHGWRTWVHSDTNIQFFQKLCTYGNNILIFPFGLDNQEEWYTEYKERFTLHNPEKQLSIVCAHRDTQELIKQIETSDILFFSGGRPYNHFEVIDTIENFKELIKDKIIAGSSGWAIMRSYAYYSSNAEHTGQWNSFLPIKIIAHRWANKPWLSWEERKKILENFWEKLPIYTIPEQEFIEFNI